MFSAKLTTTLLVAATLVAVGQANPLPKLKGVTIRSRPFLDVAENGTFHGFLIEFMDMIAKKGGFEYELYLSPDGKYGNADPNGNVTGMIGELVNKRADFALADLTVTEGRRRVIEFSTPYMVNQLAAIVRREDAQGISTLEELVNRELVNRAADQEKPMHFGSLRFGSTYDVLSKTEDPIGKKLFEDMKSNPFGQVKSATQGLEHVKKAHSDRYAYLGESTFAQHITDDDCSLAMLPDTRGIHSREFAIGLPKDSPHIEKFNKAIEELKQDGTIDALKKKHWVNQCQTMMATGDVIGVTTMAPATGA